MAALEFEHRVVEIVGNILVPLHSDFDRLIGAVHPRVRGGREEPMS